MFADHRCFVGSRLTILIVFSLSISRVHAQSIAWNRQLGTSSDDVSNSVSADGLGNVYITGHTNGTLRGANAGSGEAFISKLDAAGNLQWTRQFGTTAGNESYGVSADRLGNVYVAGRTFGNKGAENATNADAFVSQVDAAGNLQWTRQLGTTSDDVSYGVSADGLGHVYITGYTLGSLDETNAGSADAFVSRYDSAGNLEWTRQLGTSLVDQSYGVSADGLGNVYIAGRTFGTANAGNTDAKSCCGSAGTHRPGEANAANANGFVSKYDSAGNLEWTRQLETASVDLCYGVSADSLGNVYVSGYTLGNLDGTNAGGSDALVSRYDGAGTLQWTKQFGTNSNDESFSASADGMGNVYISGYTLGNLDKTNAGGLDVFVSKFDAAGTLRWTRQLGTSSNDKCYGVSADGLGNVYITGYTYGNLDGANAGGQDAFVAKVVSSTGRIGADSGR
jgi:hypothetical protein